MSRSLSQLSVLMIELQRQYNKLVLSYDSYINSHPRLDDTGSPAGASFRVPAPERSSAGVFRSDAGGSSGNRRHRGKKVRVNAPALEQCSGRRGETDRVAWSWCT